mmetsp:Transcript_843/g.2892  ORF Transcript_843/g.2892 Transcript_843/m.2892 type:complete len:457 (+) Transcript_843:340-1710(+)
MQQAPAGSGRRGQARRGGRGARWLPLQHHRGERRHQHGHGRHELLAAVARHHRGQHRDGHGRAVVRRPHHHPRLRQEHAGLPHRPRAPEPPGAHGVRRYHPRGAQRQLREARHCVGLPVLRGVHVRPHHRGGAPGDRGPRLPRRGRVRRHVHGQHHGHGHRGAGHGPAVLLLHARGGPPQAGRVPPRGRGRQGHDGGRPQAPRHYDARRLRQRHGRGHGPGGLHERRAPPHRHGARRGRGAHHRRLPEGQRCRAAHRGPQAQRQVRHGGRAGHWWHARGAQVPHGEGLRQGRRDDVHGQDACGEPRRAPRAHPGAGHYQARGGSHQGHGAHPDHVRQPRHRGCRGQDHGQGGRAVQRRGCGLRLGGGHARGARAEGDRQGNGRGHSLRGTQGRPRHARDAHADERHHGCGPRERRGAHHGWALLGRQPRVHHRPRLARGTGRGQHCARAERRRHRH